MRKCSRMAAMKRLFLAAPCQGRSRPMADCDDFDRTLMLSGMQDAAAMARYLRKNDYRPDLILCSPSARTTQTAELVLRELDSEIDYRDTLYLAEPGKILAAVRGAPAPVSHLMVVGHNPGLEDIGRAAGARAGAAQGTGAA